MAPPAFPSHLDTLSPNADTAAWLHLPRRLECYHGDESWDKNVHFHGTLLCSGSHKEQWSEPSPTSTPTSVCYQPCLGASDFKLKIMPGHKGSNLAKWAPGSLLLEWEISSNPGPKQLPALCTYKARNIWRKHLWRVSLQKICPSS